MARALYLLGKMFLIKYSTTMKNLTLILSFLFIGWSVSASENSNLASTYTNYNDSFIFVEGGVEFAVYPNGEFDFYYNPRFRRGSSVHIATPNVNISYNSGYNYDPYIQYDDYGAVIQIENVPIYYDYYGRIIQAGNIYMDYNSFGRLARVGNLHVHYNRHHHITHYSGFINPYNRRYVYRPWHDYYRRPSVNVSIVFGRPYRAYYEPRRISYNKYVTVYNNYYKNNNRKRNFYRPSQKVRSYNYGSRTTSRRDISKVSTRSNSNYASSKQRTSRGNDYSKRRKSSSVYSDRGGRHDSRNISSKRQSRTYGDINERSTNSRGRSTRISKAEQKSQISSRDRSVRSSQQRDTRKTETINSRRVERPTSNSGKRSVQTRNTKRIERPAPTQRNRTIEKSRRNSERKSVSERPTRQRSSSVRTRSSSGSSRNQALRSKNSSRSRSSARNMNNKI